MVAGASDAASSSIRPAVIDWEGWNDPAIAAGSTVRWKLLVDGERGPSGGLVTGHVVTSSMSRCSRRPPSSGVGSENDPASQRRTSSPLEARLVGVPAGVGVPAHRTHRTLPD